MTGRRAMAVRWGLAALVGGFWASSAAAQEADLSLNVTVPSETLIAGTSFQVGLGVTNFGPNDATVVEVEVEFPEGVSFVEDEFGLCSVTGTGGGGGELVTCDIGGLADGEFFSDGLLIVIDPAAVVDFGDPILNGYGAVVHGHVSADETDPDSDDNADDEGVLIEALADLRIQVVGYEEFVYTGEQFDWAIVVDNFGPSTATGILVQDTLISSGFVDANGCSLAIRTEGGLIIEFDCNFALSTGIFDLGSFGATRLNPRGRTYDPDPESVDQGRIIITINMTATEDSTITDYAIVSSDTPDPDDSNNTSTAWGDFIEAADLALTMSEVGSTVAGPGCAIDTDTDDAVTAGLDARYEITATNQETILEPPGPDGIPERATANNVVIEAFVPLGATAVNVECAYDEPGSGDPVVIGGTSGTPGDPSDPARCVVPEVLFGATAAMFLDLDVDPSFVAEHGDRLRVEALVSADEYDPDVSNNIALLADLDETGIPVDAVADISVSKTPADLPISAGGSGTFTLEIANDGPSLAENVIITDTLTGVDGVRMTDVTVVDIAASVCGVDALGTTLICSLGDLMPDESRTVLVNVAADASVAFGDDVSLNDVTVESDTADCDPTNNTASANVDVVSSTAPADLRITKFGKPDGDVPAGDVLAYTVVVDNLGPGLAEGVALVDLLQSSGSFDVLSVDSDLAATCISDPAGVAVNDVNERYQLDCVLTNPLPPFQADGPPNTGRWIVTMTVRANEPQDINNVADVTGTSFDPNHGNNHAEVRHEITVQADLAIGKVADSAEAVQGTNLTYTVTVMNNGPSSAPNVVVEDRLPGGVSLISVTASQGTALTGTPGDPTDPVVASFGAIAAGDDATLTIVVGIPSNAPLVPIKNEALTFSGVFDPDNSNNIVEIFTAVVPPPPPPPQPAPCGPTCGAGVASMMPLLFLGGQVMRRRWRRKARRS